jgi:hypothetical protein
VPKLRQINYNLTFRGFKMIQLVFLKRKKSMLPFGVARLLLSLQTSDLQEVKILKTASSQKSQKPTNPFSIKKGLETMSQDLSLYRGRVHIQKYIYLFTS